MYLVTKEQLNRVVYQELWIDLFRATVREEVLSAQCTNEHEFVNVKDLTVMDRVNDKSLELIKEDVFMYDGEFKVGDIVLKYVEISKGCNLNIELRPDVLGSDDLIIQRVTYVERGAEVVEFEPSQWLKNAINNLVRKGVIA